MGCTGWPTKISQFFFGNNFYKNKETKIFCPQLLEVYRILLVETTLESTIIYYTFSVINTMFVPCTMLLCDSTAAAQTLKLSTTLLSISCGIHLISLLKKTCWAFWNFFKGCILQTKITFPACKKGLPENWFLTIFKCEKCSKQFDLEE